MEQALSITRPHRPLAWAAAALATGVLFGGVSGGNAHSLLWFLLVITLCCGAIAAITRRTRWFNIALLCLAMVLGFLRSAAQQTIGLRDVSRLAHADTNIVITGVVDSDVEEIYSRGGMDRGRFTLRAESATLSFGDDQNSVDVTGLVDVSVPTSQKPEFSQSVPVSVTNPDGLPHYGDYVSVTGRLIEPSGPRNPGAYDDRTNLARKGIYSRLSVGSPEDWQILVSKRTGPKILGPVYALKRVVLMHSLHALPRERAGVVNAILLGSKSQLSAADRSLFAKTGTVHLLATAGLHTGLVAAMLLYALPFAGVSRRYAVALTLGSLMVFSIMAGDRPAVVRAAIMAGVYLFGDLLEREPDLTNAISLAALGLLLANPLNLFDFGFQISFATVITLAIGMRLTLPFQRRVSASFPGRTAGARALHASARYLAACVSVTVLAQVGSVPLIIYYFNLFTPAGLLANLLIVPLVAPVMALGFAAAALGAMSPILSLPLDWALSGLAGFILAVVRVCSSPVFGVTSVSSPPVPLLVLYYACLWFGLGWLRVKGRVKGEGVVVK